MAIPTVHLKKIKGKKNTTYQIDYRVNGQRIRKSVGRNRQDAELARTQVQRNLMLGIYDLPQCQSSHIKLHDLITEYLEERKNRVRANSLKRYKNYFDRFQTYFKTYFPEPSADITLISAKYINKFVENAMESNKKDVKAWTAATTNDAILMLRSLFKFAIKHKYLKDNPLEGFSLVKERGETKPDFYTNDELELIYKTIDPYWLDPIKFMVNTGLRKGELIHLKWESVSLELGNERITVEGCDEWETKTGKSRIVPLNPEAINILKKHKGLRSGLVFKAQGGGEIHPDKIYHALKKTLDELKLEGTVHKLRHTFASKLTMMGVDLTTIKQLLGHSDLETTQLYAHLAPEHLRNAVNKLN